MNRSASYRGRGLAPRAATGLELVFRERLDASVRIFAQAGLGDVHVVRGGMIARLKDSCRYWM